MKKLFLIVFIVACASCSSQTRSCPGRQEAAAWQRQAQNVTIVRDDWGIAHVYGKTDADAVFGMIYAQAEDDFNRVETNYLNSHGPAGRSRGRGARSTATCG